MALVHKYTLVCDEIRREDNGKFIVIGLYTPGITFPQFPAQLVKLIFFSCFEPTTTGTWDLDFRLTHLATGAIAGPTGRVHLEVPVLGGFAYVPIQIPNVNFQMPGDYAFVLTGGNFDGVTVQIPVTQPPAFPVH